MILKIRLEWPHSSHATELGADSRDFITKGTV
jgi:hypothetical protein